MSLPVIPDIPGPSTSGDRSLQNAAAANGNGALLSVLGYGSVVFTVTGSFSATVNFEGSEDGTNYVALETTKLGTDTIGVTTTTTGDYQASCAGLKFVRARISGYASGSVTVTANGSAITPPELTTDVQITDPVTGAKANVTSWHNADQQNLGNTANVLGTSGLPLILNPIGSGDRDKATGFDGVPGLGINANASNFLQQFLTTVPTTGTIAQGAASATVTPASMGSLAGNNQIVKGTTAVIDVGGNQEQVVVTAVTATTATIQPVNGSPSAPSFLFNHTPSYNFLYDVYNRERDASGEASGATGAGTNVAAEYEETSGGPPLANGTPSLLRFDREVAALGKGAATSAVAGSAITSTTAGDAQLTPTTPANFKTLTPGQWIRLSGAANPEYVRVAANYVISAAPATIPLTSPVVNTGQTAAAWDSFSANGPGTNPVLLTGEGLEGVLLNDAANPGYGRMWQGDPQGNARVTLVGGTKATYTYAVQATAPGYATPQDWIVIRGSATKTLKILRVELSGAATAATEVIWLLNKHTVANTAGTSTNPTPMQHDSADGAATGLVLLYTALPTIAGSATLWKTARMTLAVAPAATTVNPDRYVWDAGALAGEPLVLRGVAQELALNFNGAALPAGTVMDVAITWTEE